jgi:ABC-type multidrug transport system fused ATPase/permease subunit
MLAAARTSLSFLEPRERFVYFLLVVLRCLVGFLDVFGILLVGVVASIGTTQLQSGASATVFLGFTLPRLNGAGLLGLVSFTLAVFVVKAVIAISLTRSLTSFIARIEIRNANALANHLLRGSLERAKRLSKAEFQYAITESTVWSFTGVLNNVANIASEGFLLLIVAVAFFVVNPVVAAFAIVYFTLVVVVMQAFIARLLKRAGNDAAAGTVETTSAVSDTLDTFREISVLAKQELFLDRIHTSRAKLARSGGTLQFLAGMPRFVVETALILGVVVFVGQQLLSGELATGLATLGIFLAGAVRIVGSILPLQTAIAALKINAQRAQLAFALLTEMRAHTDAVALLPVPGDLPPIPAGPLSVSIRDITYTFEGDEQPTINDVSIEIGAGQFVAVIGPSGAGKTTIVDLILGLVFAQHGSVEIGGVEPTALRVAAPGSVSYVPQKPGLVSGTIAENIALGVRADEIDRELLESAVKAAYLDDFIESLPLGLETSVGKQADALSGGQIQRIGLARALYVQPRLLILDEATSALDAGSEAFISESLLNLHPAVTLVVIAHRLSTVQHADVVHVIEAGRVVASGTFADVKASVPMVAEYVKLMSFDDPDVLSDTSDASEVDR